MRRSITALGFILTAAFASSALAQRSRLRPLNFDADRNGLQILAQRFEYALTDGERLQIGDLILDGRKLKIEFEPGTRTMTFQWPQLSAKRGRISLLNNIGKAVWSRDVASLNAEPLREEEPNREGHREEVMQWRLKEISSSTIDELSEYPFFRFCVSNEDSRSRSFFCSRDYYLSKRSGLPVLTARNRLSREIAVEINGTAVQPQGLVYLNSPEESLFLRAQTQSGTLFEFNTRSREIDFLDVVLRNDGMLKLTARGAESTRQDQVDFIGDGKYEVLLPKTRPYFFVQGEGNIPMRQEFHVRGEPPLEAWRAQVAQNSPQRSFAAEVELLGVHQPEVQVKNYDAKADLRTRPNNQFVWGLKGLEPGETNRRYLLIEAPNKARYTASYEIERGLQNTWNFNLRQQTPSGNSRGKVRYERAIENFFGAQGSWATFRWFLGLEYDQHLTNHGSAPNLDHLEADISIRFPSGFWLRDEGWTLSLGYGQTAVNGTKGMNPVLKLTRQSRTLPQSFLGRLGDWFEPAFLVRGPNSGDGPKMQSLTELSGHLYRPFDKRSWLRYGLAVTGFATDVPEQEREWQLSLDLGVIVRF